jgi:hypothetical protein
MKCSLDCIKAHEIQFRVDKTHEILFRLDERLYNSV